MQTFHECMNTAQVACRACWGDYVWEEFDGQNLMGGNMAPSGRQNSMAKYGASWWVEFAHPLSVVRRIWVISSLCIRPLIMKNLIQQTIPDIVLEIRFWLFNQVLLLQDRYLLQWRWNTLATHYQLCDRSRLPVLMRINLTFEPEWW